MINKTKYRPTLMRTNSRHRGPSELEKYSNFILESVHDMKLLGSLMDRNEYVPGHKGQIDYINENFEAFISGGAPITANIATAGTLTRPDKDVFENLNLMSTDWSLYGGCTRTATADGVKLEANGLLGQSGTQLQHYAEEGEVLYIRLAVRGLSGDLSTFAVGSYDIDQGDGDLSTYQIPQNGSIFYLDKRLYCKHREPITLNIDVLHSPDVLAPAAVEIVGIEIQYATEHALSAQPLDTTLKSHVNQLEDKLRNIIANI